MMYHCNERNLKTTKNSLIIRFLDSRRARTLATPTPCSQSHSLASAKCSRRKLSKTLDLAVWVALETLSFLFSPVLFELTGLRRGGGRRGEGSHSVTTHTVSYALDLRKVSQSKRKYQNNPRPPESWGVGPPPCHPHTPVSSARHTLTSAKRPTRLAVAPPPRTLPRLTRLRRPRPPAPGTPARPSRAVRSPAPRRRRRGPAWARRRRR